jgi:hypothetical protein
MRLAKVRPFRVSGIHNNVVLMVRAYGFRVIMVVTSSFVLAMLVFSSCILFTGADISAIELPGIDVSESAFAELTNETPSVAVYPQTYVVKSEKPFVIEFDYRDSQLLSESMAKQMAWEFLERVLPPDQLSQLVVDDPCTTLFGVLPRWMFLFANSSSTVPIHIVAFVLVNAISGDIMGYAGEPLLPQGRIDNKSAAESAAVAILKELGYQIPAHSRYRVENFWMNKEFYRFSFTQAVGPVLIDSVIGSFSVLLDAESGGIQNYCFQWIEIDHVPTDGIVSPSIGDMNTSRLVLTSVGNNKSMMEDLDSFQLRLCWLVDIGYPPGDPDETVAIDAFSGDIVGRIYYYDEGEVSLQMLMVTVSFIGALTLATLAFLLTRRLCYGGLGS